MEIQDDVHVPVTAPLIQSQPQNVSLHPDYIDNENNNNSNSNDYVITQSFRDIRRKTLRSLYGIEDEKQHKITGTSTINHKLLMDKSPKGSVDEGIRSLVDLVNAHPSYATLSSCSGRITLFDPMAMSRSTFSSRTLEEDDKHERDQKEEGLVSSGDVETNQVDGYGLKNERNESSYKNDGDNDNTNNSGKGFGSWLISSHATITANQLINELDNHATLYPGANYALMFKHEPLLLHIAASNMSRARQLLTIACNLGFRESGLVVTPKRITVAIRSHSLSLAVPISSSGGLRPSDEYIIGLVGEANDRFRLNEKKLIALEKEVKGNLFQSKLSTSPQRGGVLQQPQPSKSFNIKGSPLPDLNLWGHSAVCVPIDENSCDDAELIVFGGYGAGPVEKSAKSRKEKMHCARSNKIFSLRRRDKVWDDSWTEIKQRDISDAEELQDFGFKLRHVPFSAREGHSSCVLPLDKLDFSSDFDKITPLIATFGGRAGPSRPNNDLLLTPSCYQHTISFYTPIDVRGNSPSPRWGHSFTALSGIKGRIGLIIGGRDEKNVLDSIHLLSCFCETDSSGLQNIYFQWDRIDVSKSIPRFHHNAVLVSSLEGEGDHEEIMIFGGMKSLHLFYDTMGSDEVDSNFMMTITFKKNLSCSVKSIKDSTSLFFGGSSCLVSLKGSFDGAKTILRGGGLSPYSEISDETLPSLDVYTFQRSRLDGPTVYSSNCKVDESIDFGSLVHHVILELPFIEGGKSNVVSLGGGVHSFAFGQSFARSYALCIDAQNGLESKFQEGQIQPSYGGAKRSNENKAPRLVTSNGKVSNTTDVIYVKNRKAKEVKVALQELGFLDRNFRMAPSDNARSFIAIPVTKACMDTISRQHGDTSSSWLSQVEGSGTQDMPYSTVVLGRK